MLPLPWAQRVCHLIGIAELQRKHKSPDHDSRRDRRGTSCGPRGVRLSLAAGSRPAGFSLAAWTSSVRTSFAAQNFQNRHPSKYLLAQSAISDGSTPIPRTTHLAILQIAPRLSFLSWYRGGRRLALGTQLMPLAHISDVSPNPVSPGFNRRQGELESVVDKGTTRTVAARGWWF